MLSFPETTWNYVLGTELSLLLSLSLSLDYSSLCRRLGGFALYNQLGDSKQ